MASSSSAASSFTVQVRSPSLDEPLTITVEHGATIQSLKQIIQSQHPKKPAVHDQRIIFAGKLLDDIEVVSHLVRKTDDDNDANAIPVLHLVVKPSAQYSPKPLVDNNNNNSQAASSSSTTTPEASTSTAAPQQQQSTNVPNNNNVVLPNYPPLLPGGFQVVALNGQYYLAPVLVPAHPIDPTTTTFFQSTFTTQQQQQQQQQQQPSTAPHVRNNNQNPAANRAATIGLLLKGWLMLVVLCHNASWERIIILHVVAAILWLYHSGGIRVVYRRGPANEQEPLVRILRGPIHRPPPESTPNPSEQQQQQEQRRRRRDPANEFIEALKRGAYTFLTSLFPDHLVESVNFAPAREDDQPQRDGGVPFF